MRVRGALAVGVAMVLGVAGCAQRQETYGAGSAGPTVSSTPSVRPVAPTTAAATSAPPRPKRSPCLFSDADITDLLGLAVLPGTRTRQGSTVVCTWKAKDEPAVPRWRRSDPVTRWDDGLVTITRAPATHYTDVADRVVALARLQKATGRQELPSAGEGGFAIGASVSGVPIWHAVAVHHGQVVAVEVSGAGTQSSLATVSDFLLTALDMV